MDIDTTNESLSHPADRPVEPEHPMMLNAGAVDGDMELMARCMIEEMLKVGLSAQRLRAMSHDAEYQALWSMRRALGARLDEVIDGVLRRVGVHHHGERESQGDVRPATLTVRGSGH